MQREWKLVAALEDVQGILDLSEDRLRRCMNHRSIQTGHLISWLAQDFGIVRIRAILSWATPAPCAFPDRAPVWGNREDTLILLPPLLVWADEDHRFVALPGDVIAE